MFLQLYIDGAAGQSSSTTFIYIKVQTSALMTQLKVLSTRACAAIRTTLVYKQQSGDAVCGNAVVHIGPIGPCTSGTPTGMQTLNFIKSCISLRVVLSRPHTSLHYQHVKAIKDVKSKSTRLNTVALYSGLQCGWRVENVSAHCNPSSVCAEENTHAIGSNCFNWRKTRLLQGNARSHMPHHISRGNSNILNTHTGATCCICTILMRKLTRNKDDVMIVMQCDIVKHKRNNAWSALARRDVRVATVIHDSMGLAPGLARVCIIVTLRQQCYTKMPLMCHKTSQDSQLCL